MTRNASRKIRRGSNFCSLLSLVSLIILSFIDVVPKKQAVLSCVFYSCAAVFVVSFSISSYMLATRFSQRRKKQGCGHYQKNNIFRGRCFLKGLVRNCLLFATGIALSMFAGCSFIGKLKPSALGVLCCDSEIGPFEFRQMNLKNILELMSEEGHTEWRKRGMPGNLVIEFSGDKEWLNQQLSFGIEKSPILIAFQDLGEICNADVVYSNDVISIRERILSKEEESGKYEQFREILSSVVIDNSIYHNVSLVDLLQRLYDDANLQLNKNGHPSMGLACNMPTNGYFESISFPSGSIYSVFNSLAERIGAKIKYEAGNIIIFGTNDVVQLNANEGQHGISE